MRRALFACLLLLATPVWALDPSEMLTDPALEARARALDHEIRCVKCQSETIASSNATWAVDARRQVREMIASGQDDAAIKSWFLERYGEFVIMTPSGSGSSLLLWLAGPTSFVLAAFGAGLYMRRRAKNETATPLTEQEQARLDEILKN